MPFAWEGFARGELGMEFRLAAGEENNIDPSLLPVGEAGSGDVDLLAGGRCVHNREGAVALDLNAVAEGGSGGEFVGAEAGAGVIDF